MRRPCFLFLLLALIAAAGSAQPAANAPVTLRGQVYTAHGAPLHQTIRLLFQSDDLTRNEHIYTDSKGQFFVMNVFQNKTYTVTVESDGQSYATTVSQFMVTGLRPTVSIDLLPLEKKPAAPGHRVSVADLQQEVPREARREYLAALDLLVEGDYVKARPRLERAIELYPEYVDARNELGVVLLKEGQLDAAEGQLRRALEIDATAVRPLLNLGLCLYRQQRYADAKPYLEKAVQLDPESARGKLLLGITLVMNGEDARAESMLRRAYVQGGANVARAQYYLSRIYTRRQEFARAAEALETYLRDAPGDPNAADLQKTLDKLRASAAPPSPSPK